MSEAPNLRASHMHSLESSTRFPFEHRGQSAGVGAEIALLGCARLSRRHHPQARSFRFAR